eukprot:1493369-Pyramimonas_sp.AAC.1
MHSVTAAQSCPQMRCTPVRRGCTPRGLVPQQFQKARCFRSVAKTSRVVSVRRPTFAPLCHAPLDSCHLDSHG